MVALNRKITFGRNDWILLVFSLGIPAIPGAVFAALGWFGVGRILVSLQGLWLNLVLEFFTNDFFRIYLSF